MATPTSHGAARHPHVLILGAGIGGLTLAQVLRRQGISYEIFERDDSGSARTQGWCVALHSLIPELLDAFPTDMPDVEAVNHLLPLTLPCQICFYTADKKLEVVSRPDARVIRANRAKLREWLGTGVDVQWGVSVAKIEERQGQVKLTMADGREVWGDVLVGADGVNSQVRQHLFPNTHAELLSALPIASIIGQPLMEGEDFLQQLDLGASAWATGGPGYHLFTGLKEVSEDGQAGRYYWLVNWHNDRAASQGSSFWTHNASKQELLDFALEKTAGLAPHFTKIIKATKPEEIRVPPLVFKDMELDKIGLPAGRITLLGDAAHPMVPFRGEGALHAIRDALSLAKAVSSATEENLVTALTAYQEEMLSRGSDAVRKSRDAFSAYDSTFLDVWGSRSHESESKYTASNASSNQGKD